MAIYIWPADTRPGPTLMGRILPDPLRNRVKYRFIKKKKKKNLIRVQVLSKTRLEPELEYDPITLKLLKPPLL